MDKTLVLIHTLPPLVSVFDRLAAQILPGVRVKHILDEPLLEAIRQRGHTAQADADWLLSHVKAAILIGANAVLVTCSTASPLVDQIQPQSSIPIFKIDQIMIEKAVALGVRITVLATNPATLIPTRQMLHTQAAKIGSNIVIQERLIEGALDALLRGQVDVHDQLVQQTIRETRPSAAVVVLAQASMARALEGGVIPDEGAPVLSSPLLALEQVSRFFLTNAVNREKGAT